MVNVGLVKGVKNERVTKLNGKEVVMGKMPDEFVHLVSSSWVSVLLIMALVIVVVYFIVMWPIDDKETKGIISISTALLLTILLVVIFTLDMSEKINNSQTERFHEEEKKEWIEEVVMPYVEGLSVDRYDNINKLEYKDDYTVGVVFSEGDRPVKLDSVEMVLDLETGEDPYLTRYKLDEKIGWYEVEEEDKYRLHISKDHQFGEGEN